MPLQQSVRFLSTPSGWRATRLPLLFIIRAEFLSTPSGWRATTVTTDREERQAYFYPRPPGGGRHGYIQLYARAHRFLSTPSGWRATAWYCPTCRAERISIHALRVEGDFDLREPTAAPEIFLSTPSGWRATLISGSQPPPRRYFYPRPPGGGRQQKRTKFSSVFAQKGEKFASLRRGKREFAGGVLKRTNFGF